MTQLSAISGVSRTAVFNIIHSQLGYRSYKIKTHQELYDDDYDRRVECAKTLLPLLSDPVHRNFIYFSDEATFHTSGRVHKQNCRIWGTEKPNMFYQVNDNSPKVNVWCAMSEQCIIGPYFFEGDTITGEK